MDADLEHLEWIKWPTTMGLGTLLYWIYSFYNSKRVNDKVDFDSITKELKDIINAYKKEIDELKKEVQEKESIIEHLNSKVINKR